MHKIIEEYLDQLPTYRLNDILTSKMVPGIFIREDGFRCLVGVGQNYRYNSRGERVCDRWNIGHLNMTYVWTTYDGICCLLPVEEVNAQIREYVMTILARRHSDQSTENEVVESHARIMGEAERESEASQLQAAV